MPSIFQRLQHSWNAFRGRDRPVYKDYGPSSFQRPDQIHLRVGNERSIITAIYNRIALDVSSNKIEHVKVDQNGRYTETVTDGLNSCLTLEANIDQTSRAFFQDAVLSMFDNGSVALVPIDTNVDPKISTSFEIGSIRVGRILQWMPQDITVEVYNDRSGKKEQLTLPKRICAIVQNPFYVVMNEPNSTLQRLVRKLNLLDAIDEQSGSGKLDLIIQLPYTVKSPIRKAQAEERRKDIEMQLSGSKYGIAYTEATERITQLNRPVENNLMNQIEYLMKTLYSQLGITPEILDGTANAEVMQNYISRTVEPILSAMVDEMKRKFLTKTARTQGHSIIFSSDPFKLVPIGKIADIAEKFVGNEILSPNDLRSIVGFKPVANEQADELRNRRLNQANTDAPIEPVLTTDQNVKTNQNGSDESIKSKPSIDYSDNIADMPISEFNNMIRSANTG